ncbi:MAG: FliO/MopB family protein [Pseudobdellovibrionaceae bacterium]
MRWMLIFIFSISISAQAAEETAVSSSKAVVETSNVASSTPKEAESVEKSKNDARNESEIPLNLDSHKKSSSEEGGIFRILFTLSMLGLVGTGAYFFIRKYSVPTDRKHQTQIKVLQQHYLGPKKSLAIVRVAGESILIGVTEHNISMIKSLSLLDDEIPDEAPKNFDKVLDKKDWDSKIEFESSAEKGASAAGKRKTKELDADEEFAISGIKDIVSKRLKGMRSLQ